MVSPCHCLPSVSGVLLFHFFFLCTCCQVQDIRAAAKVMEASNREAFDADRTKYEEEIASLHRILEGMWPPLSLHITELLEISAHGDRCMTCKA